MNEQGSPAACCEGAQCRRCLREFLIWHTKFWFLSPNPLLWSTRDRFQETCVKYSTPGNSQALVWTGKFCDVDPWILISIICRQGVWVVPLCLNVDWEPYQLTLLTGTAEQTVIHVNTDPERCHSDGAAAQFRFTVDVHELLEIGMCPLSRAACFPSNTGVEVFES